MRMNKRILNMMAAWLIAMAVHAGGTFNNPVAWADVPDPDVIRVGSDFWLVSTTMHLMPGAPIMHSRDLVNWETVGYLFDKLHDTPKYDLQGGTVYGRGQWATSLRYHKGIYYALFSPNDDPFRSYLYTTTDPRKGWKLHSRMCHFHDSSLFFDDDGRAYVFSGTGQLTELNADLTDIQQGGINQVVFQRDSTETGLLEGSRVIKHDSKYYLIMVSWPKDKPRRQVCYRADKITGPYEKKVILQSEFRGCSYVGQGTIVDDAKGNWYGFIFQDRGAVGRVPLLMPCTWTDGWPMLGDANGKVPLTMNKPVDGQPDIPLVVSDAFNGNTLDLKHWQWNHNPIDNAWKVADGHLRLTTARKVDNLYLAPNTLTQRMEGPTCSAYIELEYSHIKDGDRAGLAAFNGHSGILSIGKEGKKTWLTVTHSIVNMTEREHAVTSVDTAEKARVELKGKRVFLRIDGDFRPGQDIATFYYSLDGKQWTPIGGTFQMRFDFTRLFMGTRYALFNYATKQTGGYVDINRFCYTKANK